ncbi:hypothetical protein [Caproicibacterium sp. XB2]|uniref:hypothetical protein n=1 Tax=Caproicibacterium sp. XB2 TaxID=3388458 RepID=UPI00384B0AAB
MKSSVSQLVPQNLAVAPYTGAWIEIAASSSAAAVSRSLPTRERGLKYCVNATTL